MQSKVRLQICRRGKKFLSIRKYWWKNFSREKCVWLLIRLTYAKFNIVRQTHEQIKFTFVFFRTPLIIKTAVLTCTWKYTYLKEGNFDILDSPNRDGIFFKRGAGRRQIGILPFGYNRKARIRSSNLRNARDREGE